MTFGENDIVFAFTANMFYEAVKGTCDTHIAIIDINIEKVISENDVVSDEDIFFMGYDKNESNLFLAEEGLSSSSLYKFYFDKKRLNLEKKQYVWDAAPYARDFSISSDGKHIAFFGGPGNDYNQTANSPDNYRVYDIDSSDILKNNSSWGPGVAPVSADFRKDNQYIVISNTKELRIFDVETKMPVNKISFPPDIYANQEFVRYSKGGKLIFHLYGDKVYYYRAPN